jgi:hypothetical protein
MNAAPGHTGKSILAVATGLVVEALPCAWIGGKLAEQRLGAR